MRLSTGERPHHAAGRIGVGAPEDHGFRRDRDDRDSTARWRKLASGSRQRIHDELMVSLRHPTSTPHHNHKYFLRLYYNTTDAWMDYAETSESPTFVYGLIRRFYDIYRDSRSEHVKGENGGGRHAHWRPYYEAVEKLSRSGDARHRMACVYLGARAHTRYDLREAIVATYRSTSRLRLPAPSPAALRRDLFGAHSDRIFQSAFHRFCLQTLETTPLGSSPTATAGIRAALASVEPIWIRKFQRWREQAFSEAVERLGPPE